MDIGKALEAVEVIPVSKARQDISRHINQVSQQGYRLALTNHNKPLAAIVPISDLILLEKQGKATFADAENWTSEFEEESQTNLPRQVTLVEETAKDISSYLIGVISGRISDAGLMRKPNDFIILNNILKKTFGEAFDDKTGPNLPVEPIRPATHRTMPPTNMIAASIPEFAVAAQNPETTTVPSGLGGLLGGTLPGQKPDLIGGILGQSMNTGIIDTQATTVSSNEIQNKKVLNQKNKL